ncbi:MAG: XdhC family protein [candidate division KSB1 bacterium]|nr:XdhC family protein [candidate division KSB1 bacterium]
MDTLQVLARADEHPVVMSVTADGLAVRNADNTLQSAVFDEKTWRYDEPIGIPDIATLIGGGHVSLALSPLLAGLGMRVIVLDNRTRLRTMQSNRFAYACHKVDYDNIRPHIPKGSRSFVCIMTYGHQYDETVLSQLVNLDMCYLGMMGSPHKIRTIFEHLRSNGIPQSALDNVHAPIGLNIGSNTPEEIAVSIAAEIIAVRNGRLYGNNH